MKNLYNQTVSCCLKIIFFFLLTIPFAVNAQESMFANLYVVDGNATTLVDGNLTNYNNIYSNNVDINDGWKMTNPGINFGILRSGNNLVVERRSIIGTSDTTFFRMWNMPKLNYRIRFILNNLDHPGLKAIVKDSYLNTETTIAANDTTYYDFTVNANVASADQMRFKLIFRSALSGPVGVNFTEIQAQRREKDVMVQWEVSNEVSIASYTVEHSADGRDFQVLNQVTPYNTPGTETYDYKDIQASAGENFYRIKGLTIGGTVQYSRIVKINPIIAEQDIMVFPNPVVNKTVQLYFNNKQAGKYMVVLLYNNAVQQPLSSIQINPGQSSQSVKLPQNLLPGIYHLQITGADNKRIVKSIQVL